MATKLRWGILGTARIADALVRAIGSSRNGELTAAASRDPARARKWADERGIPQSFGSYAEMLESNAIDAVYIPQPNSLHAEWSIQAVRHGKHVLCEKPLAMNASQVEEMMAAAQQNGVKLMEAFMYRFHPQFQQVKEMIHKGEIGELVLLRATFDFHLQRPRDIRWNKELGGGSLLDVGCYCVNASRLVAGAEPVAVQAAATWTNAGVDDSVAAVLEFPNGLFAAIDCSFRAHYRQWLGISGTKAHIGLTEPFRNGEEPTTILYDHDDETEVLRSAAAGEYREMVEHFGDALLNGTPLAYPPESSLAQAKVLDALAESAKTRTRVVL